MRGDSESASKNTSKPISTVTYPKYSNVRIFENSLASDLVFVIVIVYMFEFDIVITELIFA